MKLRLVPQSVLLSGASGFCSAQSLSASYLGFLSLLQSGADGREAEGCGTVALLLEHSFEIGEMSVSSALCISFGEEGQNHR